MGRLRTFYGSMVGKKVVMGITGLIGVGFVIIHSLGNLLVFRGSAAINSYSHFLKSTGELLWALRAVLLLAVVLHVIAAIQLTRQSRAARPIGYTKRETQVATISSRTMRWGGALLLVFIVVHILHFTTGQHQAGGRVQQRGRLRERRHELQDLVGRPLLCGRDDCPWPAPLSRGVELGEEHRCQSALASAHCTGDSLWLSRCSCGPPSPRFR